MNEINKTPLYILAAAPDESVRFEKFLDVDEKSPKDLLEKPSYVRYLGWNMLTLDQAKIRDGSYWEVKNGDQKTIQLHRDGSLLAVAYADSSFLGWGQSEEKFVNNPKLNALAIIEYTYEFVELYRQILRQVGPVKSVTFKVRLVNTKLSSGKFLILRPSPINNLMQPLNKGGVGVIERDFSQDIQDTLIGGTYESRYTAFSILKEVFVKFGITPDKIPYSGTDENKRGFIDINQFPKI
jgi:hypothetical protein